MQNWQKISQIELAKDITEFVHLRRREGTQNTLRGTIAFIPLTRNKNGEIETAAVGLSLVSPGDNASRLIGRTVAQGRALKTVAEELDLISTSKRYGHRTVLTNEQLVRFIERAKLDPIGAKFYLEQVQKNVPLNA